MPGLRSTLAWMGMLTLFSGSGCAGHLGQTAPEQSPQGHWRVEAIDGAAVAGDPPTTLDIAGDGTMSGIGGCNRYSGKAEIDGGTVAIGPVVSTKMMCSPVPMDRETSYFDALDRVRNWKIEGGELLLLDGQGGVLVRLAPVQPGTPS